MYVSAVIKHHQSESDSSIFRLTILLQSSLGMVTSTISYRFVNQSTNSLRDHIHTYCKLLMQVKRAKTSKRGIEGLQKAAIAILPLTMHPQWAEPHTFRTNTCTNHIIGMAQLTTPAIPQLTILTKIPPQGVRLGARTCIFTIQSNFSRLPHIDYKLLNYKELKSSSHNSLPSTYEVFSR